MVLQECNATVLGAAGCKRRRNTGWPIGRQKWAREMAGAKGEPSKQTHAGWGGRKQAMKGEEAGCPVL
jgi:hypothetical protein